MILRFEEHRKRKNSVTAYINEVLFVHLTVGDRLPSGSIVVNIEQAKLIIESWSKSGKPSYDGVGNWFWEHERELRK